MKIAIGVVGFSFLTLLVYESEVTLARGGVKYSAVAN
jgi:hypothetical protein